LPLRREHATALRRPAIKKEKSAHHSLCHITTDVTFISLRSLRVIAARCMLHMHAGVAYKKRQRSHHNNQIPERSTAKESVYC
jgi:hypothetical protein